MSGSGRWQANSWASHIPRVHARNSRALSRLVVQSFARMTGSRKHCGFSRSPRFQGPRANGMPELHSLSPPLGVQLDKGFKVALVTDGRMSGASGKVPAAIHMTPEAATGGPLAYVQNGDILRLDAEAGTLDIQVDPAELLRRKRAVAPRAGSGYGRELFGWMRRAAGPADTGACALFEDA